ncbi:MAG: SDR family NAD(P)-dependent oxidoreductase [Proteobacteria bacterium]|nr:SDR family NAD(P)-dependent oxidoreductase [Pseudomonadota bacterium]
MASELRFDGKVVIVTGAGNGLGKAYALLFGSRGAKVVVNDLGGAAIGGGESSAVADQVVAEIIEAGGDAVANYDSVVDGEKIVQTAIDKWGRIDVVVNNAGILRDRSFAKVTAKDWDLVYQVHVFGAFKVTHAAWPYMREQKYGRIIMTSSAAGIYGNFGQTNYGMAKLGLAGFANTLSLEGQKRNIYTNVIAPLAASRLTEGIIPDSLFDALQPELVAPLVTWLCHEDCEETGGIFEVGGGYFGKLRWERSLGKMFRIGRAVRPEDIKGTWDAITGFENASHPKTINESMGPIVDNIQAGPSLGGNEFIDVDEAMGYEYPPVKSKYDQRDAAIYALGVGAAEDATDDKALQLVYEKHGKGFHVLPSYGVVPVINAILEQAQKGVMAPGMNWGLDRLLHGEQYTEVLYPMPPKAKLTHYSRIADIFDKGKGAVVVTETITKDEEGNEMVRNRFTAFVRGAGGWGGDRGPSAKKNVPPERAPDQVTKQVISGNQALLYRLSGDWNPLHVDPGFATAFGFEKPILHGLCTFGYATRHVVNAFSGGDPRYFKSIDVRFAETVFPGETLITEMWKESDTRIIFQCKVAERDKAVITNAAIELYTEIPTKPEKAAPEVAEEVGAPLEPTAADVFEVIGDYVAKNAELVSSVGKVFQFQLTDPESTWTLDVKNDAGSVGEGETAPPDCTLAMSDADFMAMTKGEVDAMKLYMGGQLKITGDLMASQRLDFLKKIETPKPKARAGAAAAPPAEPTAADVFDVIGDYVAKNADLAGSIGKVFQFQLTDPESTWTLDVKNGAGSVGEGELSPPDCTLIMSDADFMAMTKGEVDSMKLYMSGQLKITGDLMASQKLDFLKKIETPKPKARAAAPAAPAEPASVDVFLGIGVWVELHPELVDQVGKVFAFELTDPESLWTLDLKNAPGSVGKGAGTAADCTLILSEEDFTAMTRGEADAMKLYMDGKLKISGDLMASQKLEFLKKIKPEEVKEGIAKKKAAGGVKAATAAPKKEAQAAAIFKALTTRLAEDPAIATDIGEVLQFNVTSPDASIVVDLTNGGSVAEGTADAAATFTISDADLAALAAGKADARDLFQHGTLYVEGNILLAHKLSFLAGLA